MKTWGTTPANYPCQLVTIFGQQTKRKPNMNDMIFSPIDKRQLIQEIAEEVASRIIPELQPATPDDELIQIPEAMKLLGRSRTTINNWRREGFLKEQVINTRVYFKKSDILNAGHQKNGRKK